MFQYVEAIRDVMCETSGLKSLEGSLKEKKNIRNF